MMTRLSTVCSTMLALGLAGTAHAHQYGVPGQSPDVRPAGTLVVAPSVGITSQGGTQVHLGGRAEFSLVDNMSLGARTGLALGDATHFELGAIAKLQIINDAPVDLSIFGAFDLSVIDSTLISVAGGPLVGKTLNVDGMSLTPYGGLNVGFTVYSGGGFSHTEVLLGFLVGMEMEITQQIGAFAEFTVGATDGIPTVNFHIGIPFTLVGGGGGSSSSSSSSSTEELDMPPTLETETPTETTPSE